MARADRGEVGWKGLRVFAGERRAEAEAFLKRIRNEGPRAASDFEEKRTRSGWWEWSDAKRALEWLFWAGHITTATRRGSFERVYDLTERIIPAEILALPTPDEKEAQRALDRAGGARAWARDGAGAARLFPSRPRRRATGDRARWSRRAFSNRSRFPAGLASPIFTATPCRPRRISARALLAPFDPLVWERSRTMRLFDFHYRIEIYTPAEKRQHGYYVLPFLLGERLIGAPRPEGGPPGRTIARPCSASRAARPRGRHGRDFRGACCAGRLAWSCRNRPAVEAASALDRLTKR